MKKESLKLFHYIFFSKFNRLMIIFIFLLLTLISYIAVQYLDTNVPFDEKLPSDNIIELLYIDEPCASYIKATVSREEYEQIFVNGNDNFETGELIELSNKHYVEKVYVVDEGYVNNLVEIEDNNKVNLFSIPNIITSSPNYEETYPGTRGFLIKGRLPNDNMYEVVVSYEQLQNFWGFEGDINDSIGMTIDIDNNHYQIVGLTNLPVTTISYHEDAFNHYGIISVTKDSEELLENMRLEMKKQGYSEDDLFARNIFIQYNEDYTDELMDYLVNYAPSYQYSSNHVDDILTWYYYRQILPNLLIVALGLAFGFGSFLLIVGKKSFALIDDYINDADNQNFMPKKNATKLYAVLLTDFLIVLPLCLLYVYICLNSIIGLFMLLPFFLICLIIFIISILILRTIMDHKHA